MVQLVARVKAVNSFGSTWSKSLHLHVPIRDWNRQSSFEFDVLFQPSPSPPFLSPHATENLPALSTSERPYVDLSSVHTPSESLTYHHGDSDIKTAGIYSHYPQTEPPVIQTTSGTGNRPQVIFLVESPSNKTDFAVENSPEKDDIDLWVPIGLPTGILVYIVVAIILRRYVVYRKRLSEDTKETTEEFEAGEQRDERSEPLPSTVAETTSIPESESHTCPEVQRESSQSVTVPERYSFTVQIESSLHSFVGSCLHVEIDADGGEYQSGSLWLSVPANAVLSKQPINARLLFGTEWTPPADTSQKLFVFSPILSLEPQDFQFEVPFSVRFPFTAVLEGWNLTLMRAEPENKWSPVLAIDTDERKVTYEDDHCCYDLDTDLLHLSHFCKYRWCGYRKEGAFRSEKKVVCSLFAQMDPSGNLCKFNLHLSDSWQDITNEILECESVKTILQFAQKDYQLIRIEPTGYLRIQIESEDFELDQNEIFIPLEDLWPVDFGPLIRVSFKARVSDSEKYDRKVRIKLSTESHSAKLEAVFGSTSELTVKAAYQTSRDRSASPMSGTLSGTSDLGQGSDRSRLPSVGRERPSNDQVSVDTTDKPSERKSSEPPKDLTGHEESDNVTVGVVGSRLVTMPAGTVPSGVLFSSSSKLSEVSFGDLATKHMHSMEGVATDRLSPTDSV